MSKMRNEHPSLRVIQETRDKPKNTESVMNKLGVPPRRVVIIGDSGGEGPHFDWGFSVGAYLIGSMTKHSLSDFCEERGIAINEKFGVSYLSGEKRNRAQEMRANFFELTELISAVLRLKLLSPPRNRKAVPDEFVSSY